mmetsp:Transcript_60146/g.106958  ORF Transcript_60146/g.106958 Transcript_60146/m.106958 type:complete len:301 (+) Transcript_60146:46-948(+)
MTEAVQPEAPAAGGLIVSSHVEVPWWMKIDGRAVHDVEDVMDHFYRNKNQTGLESTAFNAQRRGHRSSRRNHDLEKFMEVLPPMAPLEDKLFKSQMNRWQDHVDEFVRHRETLVERNKRKAELGQLKARTRELENDEDKESDILSEDGDSPGSPRSAADPASPSAASGHDKADALSKVVASTLLAKRAKGRLARLKAAKFASGVQEDQEDDETRVSPQNQKGMATPKQKLNGAKFASTGGVVEEAQTPKKKLNREKLASSSGMEEASTEDDSRQKNFAGKKNLSGAGASTLTTPRKPGKT